MSAKEDPCCISSKSFASNRRIEFSMTWFLCTYYLVIGVVKEGQKARPLPIEMPPMIKIITKPCVFSVFLAFLQICTTVYEYNRLILILMTRWLGPLQIKFVPSNLSVFFAIQFKYNLGEIQGFLPKSCNLRPSCNHFVNLML